MEFTTDLARAAWIAPRLGEFGTIGGLVPTGFEVYLKLPHHRGVPADGWLGTDHLSRLISVLAPATSTSGEVTIGIWDGFGALHPGSSSTFIVIGAEGPWWYRLWARLSFPVQRRLLARRDRAVRRAAIDPQLAKALQLHNGRPGPELLHLPNRAYALLRGAVAELSDPAWGYHAGIGWTDSPGVGPQLIWPADRAWFVGSDTDLEFTVVGCSQEAARRVLGDPSWDAAEVARTETMAASADVS